MDLAFSSAANKISNLDFGLNIFVLRIWTVEYVFLPSSLIYIYQSIKIFGVIQLWISMYGKVVVLTKVTSSK